MPKAILAAIALLTMVLPAQATDTWRDKAIALIKKEKKVQDAIWSAPGSLWVAVADDGSTRDGYASYICLLTSDAGRPTGQSFVISIMDHRAMRRSEIRKLGTAVCG